jgi:parallel beta-helix repeat protein
MGNNIGKVFLLLITTTMLVSLLAASGAATTENESTGLGLLQSNLTSHAIIAIDNDTVFAELAVDGNWEGNGTADDPYIIENYDINATNFASGIYIGNTTVHFIIRGCLVHDADTPTDYPFSSRCYGIILNNVTNGVVDDNQCYRDSFGIYLYGSDGNTVTNNTVYNNEEDSLTLRYSDNNTVSGNDLSDSDYCLNLYYGSDGNVLSNNTCYGNYMGIYGLVSENNTIENNVLNNNTWQIYMSLQADNNTISGNTICDGYVAIGLTSSENITVTDCAIDNCTYGVNVQSSEHCQIDNVSVEGSATAIYLQYSNNVTVSDCECSDGNFGVYLSYSTYCTVTGCTVHDNTNDGITTNNADHNIVQGNTVHGCRYGLCLDYGSDYDQLLDNYAYGNYYGVYAISADGNTIDGNTLTGNDYGVYLNTGSDSSTISDNVIEYNYDGIYLSGVEDNMVLDNVIRYNGDGLEFETGADSNTVSGCTIENNYCGVYLYEADNNQIDNNTVCGNVFGIELDASTLNHILDNLICDSVRYGMHLTRGSDSNTILGNTFADNNGANDTYDTDHIQAYDDGTNVWNGSGAGNYWSDWTTPDANSDGIVDDEYAIGGGASDALPLAVSDAYVAPEMGDIIGYLIDEDNNTMANVTVSLSNGQSTVTDAYGRFTFANVTAGTYVVTFAKVDYSTLDQNVTVVDDGTEDLGTIEMSLELTDADIEDTSGDGTFVAYAALGIVVLVSMAAIVIMYFRMKK